MSTRDPHPAVERNLVLIGGRGCGKTSVAKRLARENRNFQLFSVDALIRYESDGMTIPDLVEMEGWSEFREREYAVVEKLSNFRSGALLDCGGGVVVDLDAGGNEVFSKRKVEALRLHGRVAYLRRDPQKLMEKISGDSNRPELSNTRSFLELMERRDPWYRAAADFVLDCDPLSKREITQRILTWFLAEQELQPATRESRRLASEPRGEVSQ